MERLLKKGKVPKTDPWGIAVQCCSMNHRKQDMLEKQDAGNGRSLGKITAIRGIHTEKI